MNEEKAGGRKDYRAILKRSGRELACERCGSRNERLLQVHHRDHDRENNRLENLAWLCLHCHRSEHGWGEGTELRRVHAVPKEPEGEARQPLRRGRPRPAFGERRGRGMPGPVWGFAQPCVLLLLQGGPQHGYALLNLLTEHGFVGSEVDVGNLYRALCRMEEAGWVRSEWSNAGLGPARHVYELTQAGENHLKQWAVRLREQFARPQHILAEYERAFRPDASTEPPSGGDAV